MSDEVTGSHASAVAPDRPERHTANLAASDADRPARDWLASLPWERPESLETMTAAEVLALL